jgi:hypothetical protein
LQQLTDQGRQRIDELAQRYSVSSDAAMTSLRALVNNNGKMAQFNHPELGGGGQWMRGGMTMVGDMCNYGLKSNVDGLCSELSQLLAQQPFVPFPPSFQSQSQGGGQQRGGPAGAGSVSFFVPELPGGAWGQWWPRELGFPNGSGAQNQVRYTYFSPTHRLAVVLNGHVTVYDTLDHQIGGVSQQQGSGGSLTFTSQHGTVSISQLPIVSVDCDQQHAATARGAPPPRNIPGPPTSRLPRRLTFSARSSGWLTCTRRACSRQKSSPPRRPSFCPGCELGAPFFVRGARGPRRGSGCVGSSVLLAGRARPP